MCPADSTEMDTLVYVYTSVLNSPKMNAELVKLIMFGVKYA